MAVSWRQSTAILTLLLTWRGPLGSQAAEVQWANALGGDLGVGVNWVGGDVPGTSDTAVFDLPSPGYTITAKNNLETQAGNIRRGNVAFDLGPSTWTLNSVGTMAPHLHIGTTIGQVSQARLLHGTIVTRSVGVASQSGANDEQGAIYIEGPAARLEVTGDSTEESQIGGGGLDHGYFAVMSGGQLVAPTATLMLGRNGGFGTLDISGASSFADIGTLYVGLIGTGNLSVVEGGLLHTRGFFSIANQGSAPSGFVNVASGGKILTEYATAIGRAGYGSMTVNMGGEFRVRGGPLLIGGSSTLPHLNGIGVLDIVGGTVDSESQVQVGTGGGSGSLKIRNGGELHTSNVGSSTGTSGLIAFSATSQGTVEVFGAGARWINDGMLVVGWGGNGTMRAEGGGLVTSTRGQLGRIASSFGSMSVAKGSRWEIADDLSIGGTELSRGGSGHLTVFESAVVSIGNHLRIWENGGVTIFGNGSVHVGAVTAPAVNDAIVVGTGGTLSGSGLIVANVLVADGSVSPGASPGVLTVNGTYEQSGNGQLTLEIGGMAAGLEHDKLLASQTILAGTLNIELLDLGMGTFQPQLGQRFEIITSANVTGEFTAHSFPSLAPNLRWDLEYDWNRVTLSVGSRCDFNGNLTCDLADLDALTLAVVAGTPAAFDLDGNGMVNQGDIALWLELAGLQNLGVGNSYLHGDANLDTVVDGSDFGLWNSFKFTTTGRWSHGDFNADGFTDGSDFGIWNAHKFTSANDLNAVPEPTGCAAFAAWILGSLVLRQAVATPKLFS